MPPLPQITSPSLGALTYTGKADSRGNPIYKDSKGQLITRQGKVNVLSKPASGVASNVSGTPTDQTSTFQAVLNDPDQTPIKKFSAAMGDMLLNYQNARTKSLYTGKEALSKLSQEENNKILAETPDEFKKFSPSTQSAIRSADANVSRQAADEYRQGINLSNSAAQAFLEVHDRIKADAEQLYGYELNQPPQKVLDGYKQLIESGNMNIGDVPESDRKYVIGVIDPSKIKPSSDQRLKEAQITEIAKRVELMSTLSPAQRSDLIQSILSDKTLNDPAGAFNAALNLVGVTSGSATGNRADRNNNPLNIKVGPATKYLIDQGVATIEQKPAQDGGNFLVFKDPSDGLKAAVSLLKSNVYNNLSVDAALNKWSGNGYGAEIAPELRGKTIKQLTNDELQGLVTRMAKREGYSGAIQSADPFARTQEKSIQQQQLDEAKAGAEELKSNAFTSASDLLDKFNAGKGNSAVGKSGFLGTFGYALVPGTERANFIVQFNNLKSLLSLDNVKYLKGQGQISDAERALLAQASAKLDLSQSEKEFKKALEDIKNVLSSDTGSSSSSGDSSYDSYLKAIGQK